jgi:hypothetical protein
LIGSEIRCSFFGRLFSTPDSLIHESLYATPNLCSRYQPRTGFRFFLYYWRFSLLSALVRRFLFLSLGAHFLPRLNADFSFGRFRCTGGRHSAIAGMICSCAKVALIPFFTV